MNELFAQADVTFQEMQKLATGLDHEVKEALAYADERRNASHVNSNAV